MRVPAIYTLDLGEEPSAAVGYTLADQATFVNDAVAVIRNRTGAASVTLVGHSMGGMVALASLFQPNHAPASVSNILAMGASFVEPPVYLDPAVTAFYEELRTEVLLAMREGPTCNATLTRADSVHPHWLVDATHFLYEVLFAGHHDFGYDFRFRARDTEGTSPLLRPLSRELSCRYYSLLKGVAVLSVSSGERDTQVREAKMDLRRLLGDAAILGAQDSKREGGAGVWTRVSAALLDLITSAASAIVPSSHSALASASSSPPLPWRWLSTDTTPVIGFGVDHWALLWCQQLVMKVSKIATQVLLQRSPACPSGGGATKAAMEQQRACESAAEKRASAMVDIVMRRAPRSPTERLELQSTAFLSLSTAKMLLFGAHPSSNVHALTFQRKLTWDGYFASFGMQHALAIPAWVAFLCLLLLVHHNSKSEHAVEKSIGLCSLLDLANPVTHLQAFSFLMRATGNSNRGAVALFIVLFIASASSMFWSAIVRPGSLAVWGFYPLIPLLITYCWSCTFLAAMLIIGRGLSSLLVSTRLSCIRIKEAIGTRSCGRFCAILCPPRPSSENGGGVRCIITSFFARAVKWTLLFFIVAWIASAFYLRTLAGAQTRNEIFIRMTQQADDAHGFLYPSPQYKLEAREMRSFEALAGMKHASKDHVADHGAGMYRVVAHRSLAGDRDGGPGRTADSAPRLLPPLLSWVPNLIFGGTFAFKRLYATSIMTLESMKSKCIGSQEPLCILQTVLLTGLVDALLFVGNAASVLFVWLSLSRLCAVCSVLVYGVAVVYPFMLIARVPDTHVSDIAQSSGKLQASFHDTLAAKKERRISPPSSIPSLTTSPLLSADRAKPFVLGPSESDPTSGDATEAATGQPLPKTAFTPLSPPFTVALGSAAAIPMRARSVTDDMAALESLSDSSFHEPHSTHHGAPSLMGTLRNRFGAGSRSSETETDVCESPSRTRARAGTDIDIHSGGDRVHSSPLTAASSKILSSKSGDHSGTMQGASLRRARSRMKLDQASAEVISYVAAKSGWDILDKSPVGMSIASSQRPSLQSLVRFSVGSPNESILHGIMALMSIPAWIGPLAHMVAIFTEPARASERGAIVAALHQLLVALPLLLCCVLTGDAIAGKPARFQFIRNYACRLRNVIRKIFKQAISIIQTPVDTDGSPTLSEHGRCVHCCHEDGGKRAVYQQEPSTGRTVGAGVRLGDVFRVVECQCWSALRLAGLPVAEWKRAARALPPSSRRVLQLLPSTLAAALERLSDAYACAQQPVCEYCACTCVHCGGEPLAVRAQQKMERAQADLELTWRGQAVRERRRGKPNGPGEGDEESDEDDNGDLPEARSWSSFLRRCSHLWERCTEAVWRHLPLSSEPGSHRRPILLLAAVCLWSCLSAPSRFHHQVAIFFFLLHLGLQTPRPQPVETDTQRNPKAEAQSHLHMHMD
jgi:pimeloyl-ACP methyl ester carboxylesterase